MVDVEPGEKTGIYYIPICNLPFGTSWQDFKDWLRLGCDVDHVELFQTSTSGWIRVLGEENFNKAWMRLKKDYFRNRAIIASDKNRTETIKIKELIDSRVAHFGTPVQWELAATPSHNPDVILSPMSGDMREALGPDHEFGRLPASISCPMGPGTAAQSINYDGITVLDPYTTMPETYNALVAARFSYAPAFGYCEALPPSETPGPVSAAADFGRNPLHGAAKPALDALYPAPCQSHPALSHQGTPGTPVTAPLAAFLSREGPAFAVEEACQVVVTSIQHKARPSDVSNWIRHQLGEYSLAILAVDVPAIEPRGRLRGHAYITLSDQAAAQAAYARGRPWLRDQQKPMAPVSQGTGTGVARDTVPSRPSQPDTLLPPSPEEGEPSPRTGLRASGSRLSDLPRGKTNNQRRWITLAGRRRITLCGR
ncbi:hypothetical protein E4U42_001657 [Claviceps africana]|uniref:RRM domain-containing protein n=1 Tax=Claviceps africana TaxID=83212 RepID=A0A8K0JD20_9HYPO|nr:hypothetical protein E4U42_001657 [Claviceps africana]